MKKGKLFVVSGPSGAGKSTICKIVRERLGIKLSVSATTRTPRIGEREGLDYYFMQKNEFLQRMHRGEFLETAIVHENFYGTLYSEVEKHLESGEDIILEIDVQGGLQVKKKYPDAKMIFFKAPSEWDLEMRLRGRRTDNEVTIRLRLENSLKEAKYEEKYEVVIINHSIEQACTALIQIIQEERRDDTQ